MSTQDKVVAVLPFLIIGILFVRKFLQTPQGKRHKYLLFQSVYLIIIRIPLVSKNVYSIRDRVYVNSIMDEATIRYKTVIAFLVSASVTIISFFLFLNFLSFNVYSIIMAVTMSFFFNNIASDMIIGNNELKLLRSIPSFIDSLKHQYNMRQMPDSAIIETSEKCKNPEMAAQARTIYKVLNGSEQDVELYMNNCKNKMLKLITSISYIIQEHGDIIHKGESLYLKNLTYIKEEVKIYLKFISKLKYWLRSYAIMAILPVMLPSFIEWFFINKVPFNMEFYLSSKGFIVKTLDIFVCFAGYLLIKKSQKYDQRKSRIIIKDKYWEHNVLSIKLIGRIIKAIKPSENSRIGVVRWIYRVINNLVIDSGSYTKYEWTFLHMVMSFFIALVVSITFFIASHQIDIKSITSNAVYGVVNKEQLINGGMLDISKPELIQKINEIDMEVIDEVNKIRIKAEDVKDKVKTSIYVMLESKGISGEQADIYFTRIFSKIEALNVAHLRWFEVLICFCFSFLVMLIPLALLYMQKSLRKNDMNNEVFIFETIIVLLKDHEISNPKLILEYFEMFADAFYNPIRRCIQNYESGSVQALLQLQTEVSHEGFSRIIDNLIRADEELSVSMAFDSYEKDRESSKEDRKEDNERTLESRRFKAVIIGSFPLMFVVITYLIIPISIAVNKYFNDVSKLIGGN